MRAIVAQTHFELINAARRGEAFLLLVLIPLGILLFFGFTGLFGLGVAELLPGLLALSILSASLTSLAISTGFERKYHVLKRLGATPMPRSGLIVAKAVSVLITEIVQVAILIGVAFTVFGWRANVNAGLFVAALLLGTSALSGIGLLIAGTLRAEATLAVANGLYLVLLMLGGIVVPVSVLPPFLNETARILPAAPLTALFGAAVHEVTFTTTDLAALVFWAVVGPALAAWFFTWEEK
jgi:ABC-2 type transport system permease protein